MKMPTLRNNGFIWSDGCSPYLFNLMIGATASASKTQ
jgi:hypothetical protein